MFLFVLNCFVNEHSEVVLDCLFLSCKNVWAVRARGRQNSASDKRVAYKKIVLYIINYLPQNIYTHTTNFKLWQMRNGIKKNSTAFIPIPQ